jgi:hypothetical protein
MACRCSKWRERRGELRPQLLAKPHGEAAGSAGSGTIAGVKAQQVPVTERTLVWRSYTVVGGRIDSVEQYTDRDEALAAAGLEPGDL